ncbi:hypothetical protein LK533_02365 [Sphingomonas sp. PL-96]|uniref:hypothetical protein n=1 Tax=Sphingomonas sp. PL-96 TaxID=2887201 RepID=UPI001E507D8E|nr:hypothetical protein [Sphingomonas sp. PL-96]MCC2975517.1 hypothetical protein [Sphingomonas sp. PL-96]
MEATALRERWLLRLLAAASVLALYVRVVPIGSYPVTLGGIAAALVVLVSLREVRVLLLPLGVALVLLLWPLMVFEGASLLDAALMPTGAQFLQSYGLWAGSVVLLTLAWVSARPVQLPGTYPLALAVLGVAAAQWLLAGLGSLAGFEAVAPWLEIDVAHGYLRLEPGWGVRAIGLYYEPSMCGRVVGTLALIDFVRHRRLAPTIAVLLVGLLLTQSLALLVLAATVGVILLGRSWRGAGALAVLALLVVAFQGSAIDQRLRNDSRMQADSSSYRRTLTPLEPLARTIADNPLGVPIGAGELVAERTGYAARTGEPKITNGVYEFLLYFGVFGVAALAAGVVAVGALALSGRRELAAGLLYLLLSTALSGSFLAIESSLLTYYFLVACMTAQRRSAAPMVPAWREPAIRRHAYGLPAES